MSMDPTPNLNLSRSQDNKKYLLEREEPGENVKRDRQTDRQTPSGGQQPGIWLTPNWSSTTGCSGSCTLKSGPCTLIAVLCNPAPKLSTPTYVFCTKASELCTRPL